MVEYINKKRLLVAISKCIGATADTRKMFSSLVECLPAENVVPVINGRWIEENYCDEDKERISA